jgi:hypothetical protein
LKTKALDRNPWRRPRSTEGCSACKGGGGGRKGERGRRGERRRGGEEKVS